ncbi:hypothetical protein, partial [Pseudoalteromonas sp. DY56-GL79]|uniref:hypothetical protein n=1 Tax=Pseudoalteromonas sp. DY56-GL79 TaxID=2967131 RepID=UPI00352AFA3B
MSEPFRNSVALLKLGQLKLKKLVAHSTAESKWGKNELTKRPLCRKKLTLTTVSCLLEGEV